MLVSSSTIIELAYDKSSRAVMSCARKAATLNLKWGPFRHVFYEIGQGKGRLTLHPFLPCQHIIHEQNLQNGASASLRLRSCVFIQPSSAPRSARPAYVFVVVVFAFSIPAAIFGQNQVACSRPTTTLPCSRQEQNIYKTELKSYNISLLHRPP